MLMCHGGSHTPLPAVDCTVAGKEGDSEEEEEDEVSKRRQRGMP